jgi:hypothetical protein
MRTYLERLATIARDSSSGIAPLIPPLYLPLQAEAEPPGSSLSQLEDDAVIAHSYPGEPTDRRHLAAPPAAPAPPATFEPLLPLLPAPEVVAPTKRIEPDTRAAPSGSDTRPPVPGEPPASRPAFAPHDSMRQSQRGRTDPPQAPSATRTTQVTSRARPVDPSIAIRGDIARPLGAGAPAERAQDEIRIHIGRVEVVAAVPAGPQPPPPKREHKALRLDDYLRNGGRGT